MTGHWNGELSFGGFAARVGYVRRLWDGVQAEVARGATRVAVRDAFRWTPASPSWREPGFNRNNHAMALVELWT
ncbi:MAG: hypothetical protein IPH09_15255 [bacterium]|nr:hypothetical protein [bacterium]